MVLNFESFNYVQTRLRFLDAATTTLPNFKPDGHPASYVSGLVTSARQSLQQLLARYNASNAAAGTLKEVFESSHAACVSVYGCMKSCYRDDTGCTASIRRAPKNDTHPAATSTRMKALLDIWGTLPNLPTTNAPFTAGELTKTQFDAMSTNLEAQMRVARVADAELSKDLKRFTEQNDAWDRFVSAALTQGRALFADGTPERAVIDRVPTAPATQLPEQAVVTLAESPSEGAAHLQFSAAHATSFQVLHRGPGETPFTLVDDVLLPGDYLKTGLPGGLHEYQIIGVNSRGEGPASSVITLQIAAAQVA